MIRDAESRRRCPYAVATDCVLTNGALREGTAVEEGQKKMRMPCEGAARRMGWASASSDSSGSQCFRQSLATTAQILGAGMDSLLMSALLLLLLVVVVVMVGRLGVTSKYMENSCVRGERVLTIFYYTKYFLIWSIKYSSTSYQVGTTYDIRLRSEV